MKEKLNGRLLVVVGLFFLILGIVGQYLKLNDIVLVVLFSIAVLLELTGIIMQRKGK